MTKKPTGIEAKNKELREEINILKMKIEDKDFWIDILNNEINILKMKIKDNHSWIDILSKKIVDGD